MRAAPWHRRQPAGRLAQTRQLRNVPQRSQQLDRAPERPCRDHPTTSKGHCAFNSGAHLPEPRNSMRLLKIHSTKMQKFKQPPFPWAVLADITLSCIKEKEVTDRQPSSTSEAFWAEGVMYLHCCFCLRSLNFIGRAVIQKHIFSYSLKL